MQKSYSLAKIITYLFFIVCIITPFGTSYSKELKSVALLPFEINSPDDISYIRDGITNMLHSRLSWKNNVKVVEKRIIKKRFAQLTKAKRNELIKKISQKTGSQYIITGSITQFANSFSLDTQVYDIENKRYLTFFEQSKEIGNIIPKLNRIADKINKTVFDRETVSYGEMEKEKRTNSNKWKRQNPENLLPAFQRPKETDPPVWKIWQYMF
ncbi:MAG: hypothetical protein HN417_10060 [Desulfobacula sp.]|nr:hypothetical protein [Desulfobacula sp.]